MHRTRHLALPAVVALVLGLGACSDGVPLSQAASALSAHYATHPLTREWKVETVKPDSENDKLVVEIMVMDETDVGHIKSLSRMEQFSVAKLACPTMNPKLRTAIGSDARVWVYLKTQKETLTSSICPQ